jgi:hypothetical protein
MTTQNVTITAMNPVQLVERLLEMGAKGAKIKEKTYPRIKGLPYMVELEVESDKDTEVFVAPGITASPIPLVEKKYNKEELEAMEWDFFRKVCASYDIGGRQRSVMTGKYLQATGVASSTGQDKVASDVDA